MAPEPERTQKSRERILDAAADAFMLHGFRETTIDDVAQSIGATKGLIYYHFRSKLDILLAVYERGMERAEEKVQPHAQDSASPAERLRAMSVAHLVNIMTFLGYHHVIHQAVREQNSAAVKPRQREALDRLNEQRSQFEALFRAVIEEGIAEGSFRDADPALMARTLLSSINAVDNWFRPRADQSAEEIEELAGQIVDLILHGIR
ncbi:TetR/AcrR family transcriptional regulator [Nesterenkonia cremea]|uniref:TetR family transcriptional regulator n=1 Tax=Nesterenkonia cremea TaxID=1882340 RepID=A0A917AQX3_9MICC|nr:TetR/AcrR family transcriptional regulator [Nesterenkonia cremea]GGE68534.1 TetR family transcriptional regulator [Nesterenkonia cremea]